MSHQPNKPDKPAQPDQPDKPDERDKPNKPDQPELPNSRPDPEGIILLEQFEDKLKGKFVVVTDNKVRFTDLGGLQ